MIKKGFLLALFAIGVFANIFHRTPYLSKRREIKISI
jgi:hypothetical protein